MIITTKYSIDDSIWFIYNAELYCQIIVGVDSMTTKENVRTVYYCEIPIGDKLVSVMVIEQHAYSSKDELINTITDRFYKTIERGSS